MSMFNNQLTVNPNFYLAKVDPIHKGKTFLVSLYDPGEINVIGAQMEVLDPSGTVASELQGARSSPTPRTRPPTRCSTLTPCSIPTTNSTGGALYNGQLAHDRHQDPEHLHLLVLLVEDPVRPRLEPDRLTGRHHHLVGRDQGRPGPPRQRVAPRCRSGLRLRSAAVSGFVDEVSVHVRGRRRRRRLRVVPPRGPRAQGRSRRRRRRQRAATSGSSPTATSRRCSPSRTTRTAGPTNGTHGQGKKKHGPAGDDLIVPVPEGTVVRDAGRRACSPTSSSAGDRWLAAAGGQGGRGNARFLSNRRRAPGVRRAGRGRRGALAPARAQAHGRRRARRLPERRQEHADLPHLRGQAEDRRLPVHHARAEPRRRAARRRTEFVVADIPGLIEGASEGKGLGHQFLRHVERARVLVRAARPRAGRAGARRPSRSGCCSRELGAYQPELLDRPRLVRRVSRADLADDADAAATGPRRLGGHRRRACRSLVGRAGRRWCAAARAAEGRRAEAFVVHRPVPEGIRIERERRRRAAGSSAARPSGPSPCPTSRTPTRSHYAQHRLDKLGVDRALARAGARRATSCASARSRSTSSPTIEPSARRRDRSSSPRSARRRSPTTTATIDEDGDRHVLRRGRRAARRRPPRRRGHLGGDRRRAARARPRRASRPRDADTLQAVSAVGQSRLMRVYDRRARRPRPRRRPGAARPARLRRPPAVPARPGDARCGCSSSASSRSSTRTTRSPTTRSASATTTGSPRSSPTSSTPTCSCCSPTRAGLLTADPRLDPSASLIEEIVEVDHDARGPGRRRRARRGGAAAWRRRSPPPRSPRGRACGR